MLGFPQPADAPQARLPPTIYGAAPIEADGRIVSPEQIAVIDEYAEVRQRMLAWRINVNPHAERFAELQAEILSWCEREKGSSKLILQGDRWILPVSARQMKRSVKNVQKFIEAIGGLKVYAELMPPTLDLVERKLPADKRKEYISEERTGRRMIQEPVPVVAKEQSEKVGKSPGKSGKVGKAPIAKEQAA